MRFRLSRCHSVSRVHGVLTYDYFLDPQDFCRRQVSNRGSPLIPRWHLSYGETETIPWEDEGH